MQKKKKKKNELFLNDQWLPLSPETNAEIHFYPKTLINPLERETIIFIEKRFSS